MRLPSALRGPSQMQVDRVGLGRVEAVGSRRRGAPQMLALALKVQVRGSSITPSMTPSSASHAATADAVA